MFNHVLKNESLQKIAQLKQHFTPEEMEKCSTIMATISYDVVEFKNSSPRNSVFNLDGNSYGRDVQMKGNILSVLALISTLSANKMPEPATFENLLKAFPKGLSELKSDLTLLIVHDKDQERVDSYKTSLVYIEGLSAFEEKNDIKPKTPMA
jgi:hypothetical protein